MMRKVMLMIVIGLCMVTFGILGIYIIMEQGKLFEDIPKHPALLFVLLLLIMTVIMGVWNLIYAAIKRTDDQSSLPVYLLAYRDAWRGFTTRKWLLVLACYIALMNILGELTKFTIQRYYMSKIFEQGMENGSSPRSMLNLLSISARGALNYFLPGRGLGVSHIVYGFIALSILCLLPRISRRLISYQGQFPQTSAIKFFRRLIVPIGIAALIVAVGRFYLLWYDYASHVAALTSQTHILATVPVWMQFIINLLTDIFQVGIAAPIFAGGLAFSLQIASSGRTVTLDSFLEGSIRTFKPMAGIFLLIYLIQILFGVPSLMSVWLHTSVYNLIGYSAKYRIWFAQVGLLFAVIFMFAPYAVSAGGESMWKGLCESLGIWRNCGYNLLSFIVFGIVMVTVISMLSTPLYHYAGIVPSLLRCIPSLIAVMIHAVVITVMAAAVWQFYQQVRKVSIKDTDKI